MKNSLIKKISYIACCTMLAGSIGATAAYAVNEKTNDSEKSPEPEKIEEPAAAETEVKKDETVYVLAGADGQTNKVIVSDCLRNAAGSNKLTEKSDMHRVENVKGDESYTEDGDIRTWNANGNDIYYRGTYDGQLPLDLKITYKLDGKVISPAELAGKSGKVTIRFDYTNNVYEEVEINGKKEKIYVPFAAITGMMLDNEKFRNIEITNGKSINDGDRTLIVGTAFPGLTESLGVSSDKIEIPEFVEITADVKDFEMVNTVTAATNEMFNKIDFDLGDKESTITDDINKLSDAMNKLVDGSGKLYDGLSQLLEKSSALTDGVSQLKDGAKKLSDGASQLYTGSEKLSSGLDQITENNAALTLGSKQVFQSLLDIANEQLAASGLKYTLTIDNYADTLNALIASLDENNVIKTAEETARAQVTEAVEANRAMIEAEVTKAVKAGVAEKVNVAVKAQVLEKVLETQNLTPEAYQQGIDAGVIDANTQAAINAAVDAQMQTAEVKAMADAALEQQMQSDEVKALITKTVNDKINELIVQNLNSSDVQNKIKAGLSEAKAGAKKLAELKAQLDSYNTFYTGLAQYTDGVSAAADGAKQLKDGLGTLSAGSGDLYDGIAKMDESMPALIDGITQLTDGSKQLSEGCGKFSEEGVGKIVSLVDGDLGGIIERVKALKNVSADYQTLTGGNGSVKFIYRTDAIEK